MKPIYIHSGMAGAPQYANADGNINAILEACLVNGFNSKTATSASASGGVLTLNFATDPGFEALQTVEVAVSSVALVNGVHRVVVNANNQVTIAIPGLPDGSVGSSGAGITIKQAGAGWSKPFSNSTVAVFRPPAGSRNFIKINNSFNSACTARGYEDMTDLNTGTQETPTVSQSGSFQLFGLNGNAGAPWFLLATDKWFMFSMGDNSGSLIYSTGFVFFGDLAYPTKDGIFAGALLSRQAGYFFRNYAGEENATATISSSTWLSSYTYTEPAGPFSGFAFVPFVSVYDQQGVSRGVIPNMYKMSPFYLSYKFKGVLENVGGVAGRMRPCYLQSYTSPAPASVSLDDEDWV